ncbi:MAG: hypothetical protein M1826_000350 [Phylliscum demangeonii]|nr:MAG: hypothetical protein M1826_000350 [Phylliscum demangeonii]
MCGTVTWTSTVCGHAYRFKALHEDCPAHGPDHAPSATCRFPNKSVTFHARCRECLAEMALRMHAQIDEHAAIERRYDFQRWRLHRVQRGEDDPGAPEHAFVEYDQYIAAGLAGRELIMRLLDAVDTFNNARDRFIDHIRTAIHEYRASDAARNLRSSSRLRVRWPNDDNVLPEPAPVEMYHDRVQFLVNSTDRAKCHWDTGPPVAPELGPW